ncbi:uveal autoantigen with coiled-coil domains and ankyrin repeats [Echinops telfairi]|uniref:Uveal autoantigen with coiled-coil domains and ankyrin repeats n=1 Tax=Echinops telfairi TaxID=9371 RepID=A0AC55CQ54_ECHTE|nr:uveal autoantigen with coiled-coil domains and ankyrin repeats [Echinops telfairi]
MKCWLSCAPAQKRHAPDWSKYDDRLMKAAERGDVDKVSSILAKKGVNPGKLDVEGRSAFHVVASKGRLECLNAILLHGVDITTSDTAGRNALHLAAKYGHALCLQKLLQYNCPTEHADLQGRTALHDAAMADCASSIQLLCDHGASVNARDVDGRTPLVLATQMCRPTICQLLIDRGADLNSRDKQNRTALMLGCEYGCKDAVEVLIKNGADVSLLDSLGHDSPYYARIGDNLDILTLLKAASENTSKGRELWMKGPAVQQWHLTHMQEEVNTKSHQREHQTVQDLEMENEDLKERLRKIQQEQRILVDKVNSLQLQLNEEVMVADDLESEKEKLKSLLATKEKQHEESLRAIEALKNRLKYFESDHFASGSHFSSRKEEALLKQGQVYVADSQCPPTGLPAPGQSRSMWRPLEFSLPTQTSYSESELLKKELDAMRAFCESAKQDRLQLQNELAHKAAECQALALECDRVKEDSDEQIRQLEDALKDVQKRMLESEGKVKQMQTHFLALKAHLAGEAATGSARLAEELQDQLKDMKAKYEGASAEVGKLRNQMKQDELLVEELKRAEGKLREAHRLLQKEHGLSEGERETKGRKVTELEGQLEELAAQLALSVPTERFESMKSVLAKEVNEKAKKLAELERDSEKARSDVRQLKRERETLKAQLAQQVTPAEHEAVKSRLEQRSGELGKRVADLTLNNQTLQKELEKALLDKKLLGQQVHNLSLEMKSHYVPLQASEDMQKSHGALVDNLNSRLSQVTQQYSDKKLETEKLLVENQRLAKQVSRLESACIPPEIHEKETAALKSTVAELEKQLAGLHQKRGEDREQVRALASENANLKKTFSHQYLPVKTHEEVKAALSSTLDKTNRELSDAKKRLEDKTQDCLQVKRENEALRRDLDSAQQRMCTEYISLQAHEEKLRASSQAGQEEIARLHAEIGAQRKELDTIQECIKQKYAPMASLEESERRRKAVEKELKERLSEQTRRKSVQEEEAKQSKQELDKLQKELVSLQKDLQEKAALLENAQELARSSSRKADELDKELQDLSRKHAEVKQQKEKLAEETAQRAAEVLAAQTLLQKQPVPLEQVEALKRSLQGTIEKLQEELKAKQRCHESEQQTVAQLQQRLENQKKSSVPLGEHLQMKEALEKEAGLLRARLKDKEAESQHRSAEVARLQSEVRSTKQALQKLETREVVDLCKFKTMKSDLETQISNLNEKLAQLNRQYEDACEEVLHAKKKDVPANEEKEPRHVSIEQEIKDQKERCDKSLTTITELQRRIQESAKQIEAKDNKITELLNDVERLKQALNGISQLTYLSGSPAKRQSQLVEALQHQVKCLQQQLADADRQHQEVIAIYRTHLLSAAQGHMDEDVQAALLQIIQMRQGLVC